MPIPKEITLEDIRDAAARLDAGEPHDFGPPTEYLATLNGKSYAPKALVGLAAKRVLGRDLRPSEFSSGQGANQAVGFLRQMGVDVFEISGKPNGEVLPAADPSDSLAAMCLQLLRTWHGRPPTLTREAPQHRLVWQIGTRLAQIAKEHYPGIPWKGDASAGKGNWARVPWAALFDTRITDSAQRGEYPVVHFHAEEPEGGEVGVRVGFGISATGYKGQLAAKREEVAHRLAAMLGQDPLPGYWFVLSGAPRLGPEPRGHLDRAYAEGMVLERFFSAEELEQHPEEFEESILKLIGAYRTWAEASDPPTLPTGPVRYWLIALGEGGRLWEECQRLGIAAIGWDYLGDLSGFANQQEIAKAMTRHDPDNIAPINDALGCWEFAHEIQPGDILISKVGRRQLLGVGRVTSGYRHDPTRSEYHSLRDTQWIGAKQLDLPEGMKQLPVKSLTDVTDDATLVEFVRKNYLGPDPDPQPVYTIEQALAGLFMPREELTAMAAALRERKNVVLQGPPGVGKTFIAKRLAWLCMGQQDNGRVQLVQFHQSYSYEDFVQGYRPVENGFARRDGVFYRFCERARMDPTRPHVFIIDEINRGNLSKIFGELLMLIEPDKRGPDHAIELTYSEGGERFCVPENVHLLGLMNTADRSLAMVDYALRRRFRFFDLRPQFEAAAYEGHLLAAGADAGLVATIRERLGKLNGKIASDAKNLGRGMQIGHSFFCANGHGDLDSAWYCAVIRGEIAPLLEEYWFDRPETARVWVAELLAGMPA